MLSFFRVVQTRIQIHWEVYLIRFFPGILKSINCPPFTQRIKNPTRVLARDYLQSTSSRRRNQDYHHAKGMEMNWTLDEKRALQNFLHSSPLDIGGEAEERVTQEHLTLHCGRGAQDPPSHPGDGTEDYPEQTRVAYLHARRHNAWAWMNEWFWKRVAADSIWLWCSEIRGLTFAYMWLRRLIVLIELWPCISNSVFHSKKVNWRELLN